jgi:hypothetical protein
MWIGDVLRRALQQLSYVEPSSVRFCPWDLSGIAGRIGKGGPFDI